MDEEQKPVPLPERVRELQRELEAGEASGEPRPFDCEAFLLHLRLTHSRLT